MSPTWNKILWHQFGAAIDDFRNVLDACPDELWLEPLYRETKVHPEYAEFWYIAFHTIFWLDYYCSEAADSFSVFPPFTILEPDMDYVLPERPYTKQELQSYLQFARKKCRAKIESVRDENELQHIRADWDIKTVAELLLYTMRHVQGHAAQLNTFLGQKASAAPDWVAQVTPD